MLVCRQEVVDANGVVAIIIPVYSKRMVYHSSGILSHHRLITKDIGGLTFSRPRHRHINVFLLVVLLPVGSDAQTETVE